jgi:O-antigen/teichoic acid export membrane protein
MEFRFKARVRIVRGMLGERGASSPLLSVIISVISKALAAVASFLLTFTIARYFSEDVAGGFFLLVTVVTVLSSLSRLGFEALLVRYISTYSAEGKSNNVAPLYKRLVGISLLATFTIAASVAFFSVEISQLLFDKRDFSDSVAVAGCLLVVCNLMFLTGSALQGLKRVFWSTFSREGGWPFLLVLLILFFNVNSLKGLMALYGGSLLVVAAISIALWFLLSPGGGGKYIRIANLPSASASLWIVQVATLINAWAGVLFLGGGASEGEVAIYNVALRLSLLISFILIAVNSALAPRYAELFSGGKKSDIQVLARAVASVMLMLGGGACVIIYFFAENILLLFGEYYIDGANQLRILAVGQFINVSTGSVGILLAMTGYEKDLRTSLFLSAGVCLSLCFWLIPIEAGLGAAIASASAVGVANIISLLFVRARLGFWCVPFLNLGKLRLTNKVLVK